MHDASLAQVRRVSSERALEQELASHGRSEVLCVCAEVGVGVIW